MDRHRAGGIEALRALARTVLIGHDVVASDRVVERRGALGGCVLFCDTGSGRGGRLSFVDLPRPARA